nr:protein kinase [Kofleriaceae bacterium]
MYNDDTIAGPTTLPPAQPPGDPGDELVGGRYRISRWLGGGGMGRVYAATDVELGELVALKMLTATLTDDAIERFRREVKLTRRIQHRNVARMFDIGEHVGAKFLTMELVDGEPLSRVTGMSFARVQAIARQLCDGLAAAHAAGVVHRDLKPDNVLVERGTDRAVITDFGIARSLDDIHVTQVGAVVGTPRYMAPEQLAGGEVDARADLFALGVIMYELVTGGRRPWQGDNAIAIAVAQATQPVRPITGGTAPAWYCALVMQCLAIERDARPADAPAVAAALAAGDAGATVVDPVTGSATQSARPAPSARASQPALPPITSTPTPPPIARADATTLAVLPVAASASDAYLADGVLDDLIDTLSTTPGLRVRPAGVVRGDDHLDPTELGRRLGVDHVVVAALRRAPDGTLHVSARLISVIDGFQIWAQRATCREAEILGTAEALGRGVAAALSTRAAAATRPTDPRAVELYLRARAELRRYWGSHVQTAADLLETAAEHAPSNASILGALAFARTQAWVLRGAPELAPVAKAAIERGLASGHGEAHLASGIYLINHGDPEGAARAVATALARAPMSAQVHETAGRILVEVDRFDRARVHFETACGLDPGRDTIINADLARLEALRGDYASADRRIARLVSDPDPSLVQLGAVVQARTQGWRGNREGMIASLEKFGARMGEHAVAILHFLRQGGDLDMVAWQRFIDSYRAGADRPLRPQLMGLQLVTECALLVNQIDIAWKTLAQAEQLGLMDVVWLDNCPLVARFIGSRRLAELRDRVDLRAKRVLAAFAEAA